jgi:hypothetical protein
MKPINLVIIGAIFSLQMCSSKKVLTSAVEEDFMEALYGKPSIEEEI